MAKIIFMGTPQFAVPSLQALLRHHDVAAVVTQPDAPAGRGRALVASPVKQAALAAGVPVLQPDSLKPPEVVAHLRDYAPDLIAVAAFGKLLRRDVLNLPPRGCLNVHASLLPRWRGASPISAAIAAGDAATGITIMRMDPGLDTGPLLAQRGEPIRPDDTTGALSERLAALGAELLVEVLPDWLNGGIQPQLQDNALATHCGQLRKEDGRIDWARPAADIERHIRAMSPWPAAWTTWDGKLLRVLRAATASGAPGGAPGIAVIDGRVARVQCGDGALELIEVQLEGKRPIPAGEFARGQRGFSGTLLGAANSG
jgi:methionyl-tRNA formyltransferase